MKASVLTFIGSLVSLVSVEGFNQPPEHKSQNGLLDVTLTVDMVTSLNETRVAPGYNGLPVGPTLRVSPGDTLRVTLVNNLVTTPKDAALYSYTMDPDSDHVNTTIITNRLSNIGNIYSSAYGYWGLGYANLHFHGLEVPPSIEEVTKYISNGESKVYEIKIPEDQEPGTFWYHNHVHGTAVYTFMSGLMGAIIVEGTDSDITNAPIANGAKEIIMIFSEYLKDPGNSSPMPFFPIVMSFNWVSVVNGYLASETNYGFSQGETALIRGISANVDPDLNFFVPGATFYILAIDGVSVPNPMSVTQVKIPAGGRVDFLMKFEQIGIHEMSRLAWGSHIAGDEAACQELFAAPYNCISHNVDMPLGTITVQAVTSTTGIQGSLPESIQLGSYSDRLKCLEKLPISANKIITFEQKVGFPLFQIPYDGPFVPPGVAFGVNGALGTPLSITDNVTENSCEQWHVVFSPPIGHPFHSHGAKFYVLAENGVPVNEVIWRDTYSTFAANIDIKICFDRIGAGEIIMIHCHAATHLDIGMFTKFKVQENTNQNRVVCGKVQSQASDSVLARFSIVSFTAIVIIVTALFVA